MVHCIAYSNPAFFERSVLSRDFGKIKDGDRLFVCRGSQLKFVAEVDEVINATDATETKYRGQPVIVLKGKVVARFRHPSPPIGTATRRLAKDGVAVPLLINSTTTGFKQGAFCEELSKEQSEEYEHYLA